MTAVVPRPLAAKGGKVGAGEGAAAPVVVHRLAAMLGVRTAGFAVAQATVAGVFVLRGTEEAWARSAAWWPLAATVGSALSAGLLMWFLRREGLRYRSLFHVQRSSVLRDLAFAAGLLGVAGVLAIVPSYALATALYGDAVSPMVQLIQPLPLWAAGLALVLFPVSVALTELPVYFAYVRPRLEQLVGHAWIAVSVAAGALALQHAALPLLADGRFVLWRALMFLPLAALFGIALRWRPRLLIYLVIIHFIADLQAALQVWTVS